jgi:hypothetical protein
VAGLAKNTWADVTMLAVQPSKTSGLDSQLAETLQGYCQEFIEQIDDPALPYAPIAYDDTPRFEDGAWQFGAENGGGRKKLAAKIRTGGAIKEILAEAREQESDLIILGCTRGLECQWQREVDLPEKVAKGAFCSVMVIKERQEPETIVCCLDQAHVSQSSLEMINQIVTLHQAELKIIGLTATGRPASKKAEVESKMAEILGYYSSLQVSAWIKLVPRDALEEYVAQASREGMVALWMGQKSLLKKIFSRSLVGKLVNSSQSSVLILR